MNTKSVRWSKEELVEAVKDSVSIAGVLNKLGLKPRGANYSTIKKFIKEWGIDVSHILGKAHLRGKTRNNFNKIQVPLKEVLVDDSSYCRAMLKKRLLKENLLKNSCYLCGQNAEWKNKPLIMILDHINGKNNDNRIENLRLLCPNCNSQLDTFCGRKNKKEHKCETCGAKTYHSTRCTECAKIASRKVDRPSHDQLKEDIKSLSIKKVGEKYGVSDNAIRKWLFYYNKKEGSV